jgi:hypothetical protein
MDETTRCRIRYIFLTPRPSVALMTAADHLGMSLKELKKEIEDGAIVAVSTRMGVKVSKEELMAAAMRVWEQAVIEEALGEDAASVLPEAIRLVELRARVPRYQREMLRELARMGGDVRRSRADAGAGGCGVLACRGAGGGGGIRDGDAVAGRLGRVTSALERPHGNLEMLLS